jgi:hypothetical protein
MKTFRLIFFAICWTAFDFPSYATDETPPMSTAEMKQLLTGNTNQYVQQFINASQSVAQRLPTKHFRHQQVYRCFNLDLSDEAGNFVAAILSDQKSVLILSESRESINKLIEAEKVMPTNALDALSLATESFELSRPLYDSYHVLETEEDCKAMSKLVGPHE